MEYHAFCSKMRSLMIQHVGEEAGRWADLVGKLSDFPEEDRQALIQSLAMKVNALGRHPDLERLWYELRRVLHHHRSFPDQDWAMSTRDLDALDAIYQSLVPTDPVARYVWIFDHRPDLPGSEPHDYLATLRKKEEAQRQAVTEAYQDAGIEVIAKIAKGAGDPASVGVAAARVLDSDAALDLTLSNLESVEPKLRNLARGIPV